MKLNLKTGLLLSAAILFFAGAAQAYEKGAGAGITRPSGDKGYFITDYTPDAFTSISIEAVAFDIEIASGPAQNLQIKTKQDRQISWSVKDNVLFIKEPSSVCGGWFKKCDEDEVKITLPTGTVLNSVKIKTTNGDIDMKNTTASALELRSVSGDIDLKKVLFQNAVIESVSGDIDAENILSKGLGVKSVSGDIEIRGSLEGGNTFNSKSGDIEVRALSSQGSYVNAASVSGRVLIDGQNHGKTYADTTQEGNPNKFIINSVSGSVKLYFDK